MADVKMFRLECGKPPKDVTAEYDKRMEKEQHIINHKKIMVVEVQREAGRDVPTFINIMGRLYEYRKIVVIDCENQVLTCAYEPISGNPVLQNVVRQYADVISMRDVRSIREEGESGIMDGWLNHEEFINLTTSGKPLAYTDWLRKT